MVAFLAQLWLGVVCFIILFQRRTRFVGTNAGAFLADAVLGVVGVMFIIGAFGGM